VFVVGETTSFDVNPGVAGKVVWLHGEIVTRRQEGPRRRRPATTVVGWESFVESCVR
jgi:hypothetical protein